MYFQVIAFIKETFVVNFEINTYFILKKFAKGQFVWVQSLKIIIIVVPISKKIFNLKQII